MSDHYPDRLWFFAEKGQAAPTRWVAHDDVTKPFSVNMYLCDCARCRDALAAEVARTPRTNLLVRSEGDRLLVTAELALDVWERTAGLEGLLYLPADAIRDVSVPEWPPLWYPQRWFSTTCREDELLAGRTPAVRRVPARQSRAAARRRAEWLADHPDERLHDELEARRSRSHLRLVAGGGTGPTRGRRVRYRRPARDLRLL